MYVVQSTGRFKRRILPNFSNQKQLGYSGVKNWLRNGAGLDPSLFEILVLGERDFHNFREPSVRWDRSINAYSSLNAYFMALGVARKNRSGQETIVKLKMFEGEVSWHEFKKEHKVLMLVRVWKWSHH